LITVTIARLPPRVAAGLIVLCLLAAGVGVYEATADAPTIDEPVYVSAGVASLVRHDLRLNTQHPPLAKALAALPVLLALPSLPSGRLWQHHHDRPYARAFQERARVSDQLHEITLLSRIVPLLELILSGLAVFALARRLGGDAGGLLSAALWLGNPYVLGIGHVDGIDVPFALATLVVVLTLVRWLERPTGRRVALAGLACGAAMLTRDTGPLLLVVALGLVGWRARRVQPVLVCAVAAGALIWAAYLVLDPAYTLSHFAPLPQRYIDGLRALVRAHQHPAPAFLLGHLWAGGRWWFWPGSMLVKLPASLLACFALAPWWLRRAPAEPRRRVLAALVPSALLLTAFTVAAPVDFGLRYLLPVLALLCVACAPLVALRPRALPWGLVAVGAAFVALSFPYSIAWIAPPFGPGYETASAGNFDWGQDAWRLQDWARGKRPWIACYTPRGSGCVEDVVGARALARDANPAGVHGWVAMSATLRNLHGWDPWLRRLRPVGTLGDGTELLYRVP
jgi:hypothetical protein